MEPMMLKESYFIIAEKTRNENEIRFQIELSALHEVYKGHFPGMPVCPGVCNMEMIKECVEEETSHKLILTDLSQCKFSAVIKPEENPLLLINMNIEKTEGNSFKTKAKITDLENSKVFVEFKGEFQIK